MRAKQWRILGKQVNQRDLYIRSTLVIRTAIGLKVKDGVVLAVEKWVHSKLLIPEANRRIATIDRHIGLVCCLIFGPAILEILMQMNIRLRRVYLQMAELLRIEHEMRHRIIVIHTWPLPR